MGERSPRVQRVLAAGAVFTVIVAAQAIAGSGNDPAARGASQQIKKLKKQVKQLKQRVASIENNGATPKGPAGGALTGTYPDPGLAPPEALQVPTLANCVGATPWAGPQAFAKAPRFWKDASGVVHLQGSVGCAGDATEGGTIFNLPAGYRPGPNGVVRFLALGSALTPVQLAVLDTGGGALVFDGPNSSAVDDYISLDGITFRAED